MHVMFFDGFANSVASSLIPEQVFTLSDLFHPPNKSLLSKNNLSIAFQISSWDDYFYDLAARNSIDVGEFVGRCLAGVIQQ